MRRPTLHSCAESRDSDTDDPITRRSKCKQFLEFATYSVRSLGNKFSSVSEFITDNNLDLAAITETWLLFQDDARVRRPIPPGYRIIDAPPSRQRGGGIILYLRDHFVVKSVDVIVQRSTIDSRLVFPQIQRFSMNLEICWKPWQHSTRI